MGKDKIVIKGARTHNLKNIDVTIPRDRMVVVTGLSGSGKSSLAFDTLYSEGQRLYVESLSSYARQFLGQMDKPDVDSIDGLSPAISIDQKTTSQNPRSTVGTVTEINDYLRLLWARVGHPICPNDGNLIEQQSVEKMVDSILELDDSTKVQVLSPLVRSKKGQHKQVLENVKKEGFVRVSIDGETYDLDELPELNKNKKHTIDVVIDRMVIKASIKSRLYESVETAVGLSEGYCTIDVIDGDPLLFSEHYACSICGFTVGELEPRLFSFNAPFGACEECDGLGLKLEVDVNLVIPDPKLTLKEGAISSWNPISSSYYPLMLEQACKTFKIPMNKAFNKLTTKQQDIILYGSDDKSFHFHYENEFGGTRDVDMVFEGVINNISRRYQETSSDFGRDRMRQYMQESTCHSCDGYRLNESALAVQINGSHLGEVLDLPIVKEVEFFNSLKFSKQEQAIAKPILKEINSRLAFLKDVGLEYLNLSRSARTLSGGEAQRIRLATQIGSNLSGVLYILDEPSIGLHQRDNSRLINSLHKMRDLGNTLIVVEHDEETMMQADYLIDIGPGAGEHGGKIMASGTPKQVMKVKESITGQYLSGQKRIEVPKKRRKISGKSIKLSGVTENNLKNVEVKFPLGTFISVTGVSGSGKSTLVNTVLKKALSQELNKNSEKPGKFKKITGVDYLEKVININQKPIGRTPRSNPATYTGLFDDIRDLFSQTNEAQLRGYKKGRFSFNVKGGRCESCRGDGILKIEMNFLPDVYVPCEECHGTRYNTETLEVKYKGKNIAEILDMTVEQGIKFFEPIPKINNKLKTILEVGLGYVRLGQSATTLSGGEAQRMKLASELHKKSQGKNFYILDEPTTGLHIDDVKRLLEVLHKLVDQGNTVLVIEHNLDVIKTADYLIDLGPEGGSAGGTVLATGTPETLSKVKESYTGQYLKNMLAK